MQFNIEEILHIAKKIESNGYKFYTAAAAANETHREWLTQMAQDEIGHESVIDDFARALVPATDNPDDPDSLVLLYLHSIANSLIFSASEDPAEFFKEEVTIDEIIADGLRREHEAVAYYTAMQNAMQDTQAKAQIDLLIKEEMSHIAALRRRQEEIDNQRKAREENRTYELIIVGAGPGGISMAAEVINAGMDPENVLILEGSPRTSWMIRSLYSDEHLVTAAYKGAAPETSGIMKMRDMSKAGTIQMLAETVRDFKIKVLYDSPIHTVENRDGSFHFLGQEHHYRARFGVISIGVFSKPERPDYPIPASLSGKVSFEISSKNMTGKNVLVVGGGDSAAEFVQSLTSAGNRVTLSCRETDFAGMSEDNRSALNTAIAKNLITAVKGSDIRKIVPHTEGVQVLFHDEKFGEMLVDHIYYALGGATPLQLMQIPGLNFTDGKPELNEANESNIAGLYLTGDLAARTEHGAISTAFNSSHVAARHLIQHYFPELNIS